MPMADGLVLGGTPAGSLAAGRNECATKEVERCMSLNRCTLLWMVRTQRCFFGNACTQSERRVGTRGRVWDAHQIWHAGKYGQALGDEMRVWHRHHWCNRAQPCRPVSIRGEARRGEARRGLHA